MPALRSRLFAKLRPGYLSLTLPVAEVKAAIESHPEFQAFTKAAGDTFAAWRKRTDSAARAFDPGGQALTTRVRTLAERYATPLPQLEKEVETLAARVAGHLKAMGAAWN